MPWIIVIILCMATSCTIEEAAENSYSNYTKFSVEKRLSANVVTLDTVIFRYPFRISVKDSVVVILDLHNVDNYFHAFSYPDFKHIVSFGKRGDGPEELLSAETIRFESLDSIWTVDANKMQIKRFSISPSQQLAEQKEIIPINRKAIRTLDIVPYTERSFIVPDYTGNNRYCHINKEGEIEKVEGTIPTERRYRKINMPAVAQAWRSFIDYNPQNDVLALATQLGEVLEIYNFKDTTHYVMYGPEGAPKFKIAEGYGVPVGIMGFSDIHITDSLIYTVFQGRSFKDIAQQRDGEHISGGQNIYVFNLKGEPVRKYILDHHISAFCVDEKRGVITAVDVNNNDPIIEFNM